MGLPGGKLLAPKTRSLPVNGRPADPNLSVSREIGRQRRRFFSGPVGGRGQERWMLEVAREGCEEMAEKELKD